MTNSQQLFEALSGAFSPDASIRVPAQESLEGMKDQAGYATSLFELCMSTEIQEHMRQLCAVEFKNRIRKRWLNKVPRHLQGAVMIDNTERAFIRQHLIDAVVACQNDKVRTQLLVAFKTILIEDFPEIWPEAANQVIEKVQNLNPDNIVGVLQALRQLMKSYDIVKPTKKARDPLFHIVDVTFPILLPIFQQACKDESETAASVRKVMCQIVHHGTMYVVPPKLRDAKAKKFAPWIQCLLETMSVGVPENVSDKKNPHWSCKKWALHGFNRILHRFSEPKQDFKNKAQRQFAFAVQKQFFPLLIEKLLGVLNALAQGVHLPDKLLTLILSVLSDSVIPYDSAYKLLQSYVKDLLNGLVFPLIIPNEEMLLLFEQDPRSYLRMEFEADGDEDLVYTSRFAALHFYRTVFTSRPENMPDAMAALVLHMQNYTQGKAEYTVKCAALHVIGACRALLLQRSGPYRNEIENMLVTYLFPEFKSEHPVLRARAAHTFGYFAQTPFDPNRTTVVDGVQALLQLMQDPTLPVRVQSAVTLGAFVDEEKVLPLMEPLVGELLQAFIEMMEHIESDELVSSLQRLCMAHETVIQPHALTVCQYLVQKFSEYAALGEGNDENEDGDDLAMLAAYQVLAAVRTIILACQDVKNTEFWTQLTDLIVPLHSHMLEGSIESFVTPITNVFVVLTYAPEQLTPNMWQIFDPIVQCFANIDDPEMISTFLAPLDNLIEKDTIRFVEGDRVEKVLAMCDSVFKSDTEDDETIVTASRLMESVVLNCGASQLKLSRTVEQPKGAIDAFIPKILESLLWRLQKDQNSKASVVAALYCTIFECFIYGTRITLPVLETMNATEALLRSLLEFGVESIGRLHDKKMIAMGLICLLYTVPLSELPESVKKYLAPLMAMIIRILDARQQQIVELIEQEEEEEKRENEILNAAREQFPDLSEAELRELVQDTVMNQNFNEDSDFDDDDDDNDDIVENDDDDEAAAGINDDFMDKFGNIEELVHHMAEQNGGDWDNDDGHFGSMVDNDDEELAYNCPLDHINELEFLLTRVQEGSELDADVPALLASLVDADREALMTLKEQAEHSARDRALNPNED
mmetsp:Transcript_10627/g.17732  ORF Transcript_10627/g.17732 Transcript_10627/m.17732 type:complete len:1091 (+) Transcript_10627:18-3290(+)